MRPRFIVVLFALAVALGACTSPSTPIPSTTPGAIAATTLRLIAGSGFSSYEPMLKQFAQQNGVQLDITYKGSLDIMRLLEAGTFDYDVIWEADSLWTSIGDKQKLLRDSRSIACSPIVFGVKKSIAQELGWVGKTDVHMQDILAALQNRKLRTLMTSATQSNSGASAYFGFLYAFAGQPDLLTPAHLQDKQVREQVKRILGTINRTSESSGWLRDLFIKEFDNYDAMFNYESHVIAVNMEVTKTKPDPLYIVYPVEGLGIADFPMSFVSRNNDDKKPIFQKMQQFLLSKTGQDQIAKFGRRVGPLCNELDQAVNRSDWGVDPTRIINTFRYPAEPVIWEALNDYQTAFRKPSFTIYALDFSGSMGGKGEQQLKEAMRILLEQDEAAKYLLQGTPDDITVVIPFDEVIRATWLVRGNDSTDLKALLGKLVREKPEGMTDIWTPTARALAQFKTVGIGDRIPAIILMTDGQSNRGNPDSVRSAIQSAGNVPVCAIAFGEADKKQLQQLADLTKGRVFDGTKELILAFRNAKACN